MADAKLGTTARPDARPLSPHLFIFRPYINMVMSIFHRITGAANYFGSLLLAIWLMSAAAGETEFNQVSAALASIPGLIILFGFTWSVMHHMLGGVRHMIWDTGHGFEIGTVKTLSYFTLLGSLGLTAAIWAVVLAQKGVLNG